MKRICPHNYEVDCEKMKCDSCGWNPKVSMKRVQEVMKNLGSGENLYKIPFTGFCEVWANSLEEAAEKVEDVDNHFFARYDYGEPECIYEEVKNGVDR